MTVALSEIIIDLALIIMFALSALAAALASAQAGGVQLETWGKPISCGDRHVGRYG